MAAPDPICLPGGQFAFPRSYCTALRVRHDPGMLTLIGNVLTFIVAGPPDALVKIYFHENFIPWTSNRWTLDHVTTNATYEYPPNPTTYPLPWFLQWMNPPDSGQMVLLIDAMYGANYSLIELPPAPPGYWTPPPYGV